MVAAFAMIELFYWLLTIATFGLALLTQYWVGFGYIHSAILLLLLYLVVVRIPLALNWSKNMYGTVLNRTIVFCFSAIITYAISYQFSPTLSSKFDDFWDALYFSATTWTTLGYGDISPTGNIRILTSLEAITGLLTFPVIAATVWLYCEQRIKSHETPEELDKREYLITLDTAIGVYRDSEEDPKQRSTLDKIKLNKGCCDEPDPYIQKYYDIHGVITPLANYIVTCKNCGSISKPSKNAYLAALNWNRKYKIKPR